MRLSSPDVVAQPAGGGPPPPGPGGRERGAVRTGDGDRRRSSLALAHALADHPHRGEPLACRGHAAASDEQVSEAFGYEAAVRDGVPEAVVQEAPVRPSAGD